MMTFVLLVLGIALAAIITLLCGVYSIDTTERGVMTTFGRAERIGGSTLDDPSLASLLREDERQRYVYPQVRVIPPGGPYFKWPWQQLYRVNMTIRTTDISSDPEVDQDAIEVVTNDELTICVSGQIRWKPCERNLYAFIFGVRKPDQHVLGYFVSVLRERIAKFQPAGDQPSDEVSINFLRKNLSEINRYMEETCRVTAARYGVEFDRSLITEIAPPKEVEDALASINTTQNEVAAKISQARADADQTRKAAETAVQIARNRAEAEVAPLRELATNLDGLEKVGGEAALDSYIRNASLPLREKARKTVCQL